MGRSDVTEDKQATACEQCEQLTLIIKALLGVVTPAQFAAVREELAVQDLDFPW